MTTTIHVVGLGVEAGGRLNASAEAALRGAAVIIGSRRQLDWLRERFSADGDWPPTVTLPALPELPSLIDGYHGDVAVLASGDPMHFGIGRWFSRRYPSSQLRFHGALSSIQAACSRLGLALEDCIVLSVHGRPLENLYRHLLPGRTLIVLTDASNDPATLAAACLEAGLDRSHLWVCERLGYPEERVRRYAVNDAGLEDHAPWAEPNVCVLQLQGRSGFMPAFPGIPDTEFITDGAPGAGMLSKREVRLQILSLLQTGPGDCAWDIGAGCGGVATELALWQPGARVIAVERDPARLACLRANRVRFGALNLEVVEGSALEVLGSLPDPQRVFIGGSGGALDALLAICWDRLAADGVLVASAVTEASRETLRVFGASLGGAWCESVTLAVSRGELQGDEWTDTAKLPVELFRFEKMARAKPR